MSSEKQEVPFQPTSKKDIKQTKDGFEETVPEKQHDSCIMNRLHITGPCPLNSKCDKSRGCDHCLATHGSASKSQIFEMIMLLALNAAVMSYMISRFISEMALPMLRGELVPKRSSMLSRGAFGLRIMIEEVVYTSLVWAILLVINRLHVAFHVFKATWTRGGK